MCIKKSRLRFYSFIEKCPEELKNVYIFFTDNFDVFINRYKLRNS